MSAQILVLLGPRMVETSKHLESIGREAMVYDDNHVAHRSVDVYRLADKLIADYIRVFCYHDDGPGGAA